LNLKVKASEHRFKPRSLGLVFSKSVSKQICFDYSCKYDLKTSDQFDINKLFGIGYWPHHHQESARFGWRWNTDTEAMEIWAYIYSRGRRISQFICQVRLGALYDYGIYVQDSMYVFVVTDNKFFRYSKTITVEKHMIMVGYKLGAYFGGNMPAPKEMIIKTKK
jgi:hypothetical protein